MYFLTRAKINHLQVCKYKGSRGIVLRSINISNRAKVNTGSTLGKKTKQKKPKNQNQPKEKPNNNKKPLSPEVFFNSP